ncbi:sugar transferase [Desulfobacterales bacterium HSG17]|nr:sugar transferase [Desulfobacterales bacterium HSG17]
MKCFFDFLVSIMLCVLLLPIFVLIAVLVRLKLGTPILFKQQRPGLNAKPFILYKFRSMTNKKSQKGELLPDAERLTRFSRFLRASSLDELPELINILKGEMCLVGPRPLLMRYLKLYNYEQAKRHDVKPGITGWAQVNGRNAISWEDKFKMDVWYINNQSFYLDIKILLLTVIKVCKREGVNQEGQVTTREFMGNN